MAASFWRRRTRSGCWPISACMNKMELTYWRGWGWGRRQDDLAVRQQFVQMKFSNADCQDAIKTHHLFIWTIPLSEPSRGIGSVSHDEASFLLCSAESKVATVLTSIAPVKTNYFDMTRCSPHRTIIGYIRDGKRGLARSYNKLPKPRSQSDAHR